jgi:hypothetical protein
VQGLWLAPMPGLHSYLTACGISAAGATRGMHDIETIDAELRLVAALRWAARERGGPLPSIDVADALLDERLRAHRVGYNPRGNFHTCNT